MRSIYKICLLFFILCFTIIVNGQDCSVPPGFSKKSLIIKKPEKLKKDSDTSMYLAMSYDFGDSISICINGKTVFSDRLNYGADTDSNANPYDRRLIRLTKQSNWHKADIYFWKHKYYVSFIIEKQTKYLSLNISRNRWVLHLLNDYPWID